MPAAASGRWSRSTQATDHGAENGPVHAYVQDASLPAAESSSAARAVLGAAQLRCPHAPGPLLSTACRAKPWRSLPAAHRTVSALCVDRRLCV